MRIGVKLHKKHHAMLIFHKQIRRFPIGMINRESKETISGVLIFRATLKTKIEFQYSRSAFFESYRINNL